MEDFPLAKMVPQSESVAVSGNDPLNLVGIIFPGNRVPSVATNRVVYRDGLPISAVVGGQTVSLVSAFQEEMAKYASAG